MKRLAFFVRFVYSENMKPTFLFPTLAEVPFSLKKKRMRGAVFYPGEECAVLCTGPGQNTAATLSAFSRDLQESYLVLLGYAGAIVPLNRGELVVCKRYLRRHSPTITSGAIAGRVASALKNRGLPVREGDSYTIDHILSDPKKKRLIARKKANAMVVEMENYWAAAKARELGIPFVSVRIVLDMMEDRLPDLMDTVTPSGEIDWRHTFWHLSRCPCHVWPMLKLARHSLLLLPRLARCCKAILEMTGTPHQKI